MSHLINAAIQVLPRSKEKHEYDIVDVAIEIIKKSGLTYRVCPFETVIEGEYAAITKLIEDIQHSCFKAGAESMLINIKLQIAKDNNVYIQDKMKKYE